MEFFQFPCEIQKSHGVRRRFKSQACALQINPIWVAKLKDAEKKLKKAIKKRSYTLYLRIQKC